MRVSTSVLVSFAAIAAATDPADGNIVLTVPAGSNLEGYQVVGYASDGAGFPELVPAAEVSQSQQDVWYLKGWDYGFSTVFGISAAIDGTTYELTMDPYVYPYAGPLVFQVQTQTETRSSKDSWFFREEAPEVTWSGDTNKFPFACTRDDGRLQLTIYNPSSAPEDCEQISLQWASA
ncbi:hypothetical protein F5Y08DRAFT_355351 [Xylaria arbuscula]|nr:hypothetical protein F5Y08DRAFT_355351 [Xylaria arbuscula]